MTGKIKSDRKEMRERLVSSVGIFFFAPQKICTGAWAYFPGLEPRVKYRRGVLSPKEITKRRKNRIFKRIQKEKKRQKKKENSKNYFNQA